MESNKVMNDDKEEVKAQIRELTRKIRESDRDGLYSPEEWEIATLTIEYSIRHGIEIPLINYERYKRTQQKRIDEEADALKPHPPVTRRRKIDQPEDAEEEADYDPLEDFVEAATEHHFPNPRFTLHPDIRELVDCSPYGEPPNFDV